MAVFGQGQFIGEIKIFAGNFAPTGWAKCEGQLLLISQNYTLFSIIGTFYGGNGTSNFALPDLRERVAIGSGQGVLLPAYTQGETGGVALQVLNSTQLPAHNHMGDILVSNEAATTANPLAAVTMAVPKDVFGNLNTTVQKYNSAVKDITLPGITTSNAGASIPVDIQQPFLVCNYIIALTGVFPSRQ